MTAIGTLYVVATPIGNFSDLTPRAASVLEAVELIASEDTRIARTLLAQLGFKKKLVSCHEHNEQGRLPELVGVLEGGGDVALISDQGTPLVSDPGYHLVQAAIEAGAPVVAIPGVSAVLAALSISGLAAERFHAVGFPPRRAGKRRSFIEELRLLRGTLVLFEAPHRIAATLRDLSDILGPRSAALCCNLTKKDESVQRDRLDALADAFAEKDKVYGAFTLVLEGASNEAPPSGGDVSAAIDRLLDEGLPVRTVRDLVADLFGLSRKEAYAAVLARTTR